GSEEIAFHAVAFSPKQLVLAAGQHNGEVRLWNAVTGLEERRLDSVEHRRILAIQFDAEGQQLFAAGENAFAASDLRSGKRVAEPLWDATWVVVAAAFRADGQVVAAATSDGRVHLWSAGDRKKALTVKGPGGSVDTLAFSPDGGRLAGGSNGGDIVM